MKIIDLLISVEKNELKKELGIDEWLELMREDKNLNGGYISIAQYIYLLEEQLKKKDEVIDEAIEYIEANDNSELGINQDKFLGKDELLDILNKYKRR